MKFVLDTIASDSRVGCTDIIGRASTDSPPSLYCSENYRRCISNH